MLNYYVIFCTLPRKGFELTFLVKGFHCKGTTKKIKRISFQSEEKSQTDPKVVVKKTALFKKIYKNDLLIFIALTFDICRAGS